MKRNTLLLTVLATLLFGALFAVSPAAAQSQGDVNVTLDPEQSTVEVGEIQTYEVVVEGPDSGILAYDNLEIGVDSGVAEIVAFRENHTGNFSLSEIQDNNSTLSLSAATEDDFKEPAANYTLVEFDVEATAGGSTGVSFNQSANATVTDYNDTAYNIQTLSGATLTADAPPNFQVSNVQPADATVTNGTLIDVSADIENVGTVAGTQDITLTVGGVSATKTETLNASENTTVTFTDVDTGALGPGSYTHTVSSANDSNSGNLTVETEQGPAVFDVSNVQPADATVTNGTAIDVSADIENTGDTQGTQDITLSIDGFSQTTTETLNASENTTVTFSNVDTGALGPGTYTHEISSANDSASGNLTVEPSAEFSLEFSEQSIENGNVTVENVTSGGVEAAVVVTYQNASAGETGLVVAGQTVGTFDGENVQVTLEDTSALGKNYTAHILPADELSNSTETDGVVSSETADAIEASQKAFVSVEVVDGQLARDTTGDGLLNNVRGSDGFNILDVQALFNNLESPELQNNVGAFDFQDDEGINILDVQALFNQL